jgi:hypothetical protein
VASTADNVHRKVFVIRHVDDGRSDTTANLAWEWAASLLPATTSNRDTEPPIGSAVGYLVDLRSGGRAAQRELGSLAADTEALAALLGTTSGSLDHVPPPHTSQR